MTGLATSRQKHRKPPPQRGGGPTIVLAALQKVKSGLLAWRPVRKEGLLF
jgi:hypothetical protein